MIRINFDMDGTIADLYAVENWLPLLRAEDTRPYAEAKPMLNFSQFARLLHKAQRLGFEIAIISWTAKNGTDEYNDRVAEAKREWLARHLPSVVWDEITICPYGTPKCMFSTENDILFDDEAHNREEWNGTAYDVEFLIEVLKNLLDK